MRRPSLFSSPASSRLKPPEVVTPESLKQAVMNVIPQIGLDGVGTGGKEGFFRRMETRDKGAFYDIVGKVVPTTRADEPSPPTHYEVGLLPPEQWPAIHLQLIADLHDTTVPELMAEWDALTQGGTVSEKTFRQITAPPDDRWREPWEVLQDIFDRVAAARSAGLIYEDAEI
jgi:hypothetical protein